MAKGKRTQRGGRFVTLRSGRVIFIPHGSKRQKWADVRDKILGGEKPGGEEGVPYWKREGPKRRYERREKPRLKTEARWEKAGLKPQDFGVKTWREVDPEVVEDVLRQAAGPKPKRGKRRKVTTGGRTYNIPEVK